MPFLYRLFASTRLDVQMVDWSAAEKEQFLRMQFDAQHSHYQKYFATAQFSIILSGNGESIGRLYLHQGEDEFRIVDISLMPKHRRRGIGSAIISDIMDRA